MAAGFRLTVVIVVVIRSTAWSMRDVIEHKAEDARVAESSLGTLSDFVRRGCYTGNKQNRIGGAGKVHSVRNRKDRRCVDHYPIKIRRYSRDEFFDTAIGHQFGRVITALAGRDKGDRKSTRQNSSHLVI